jgi:VWFA-related protein
MLAGLLLFPPSSRPQQPPTQQTPQDRPIRVDVSLVNLFASVRDKSKRMVPNLSKDEFRVFEDGQEQTLDFFKAETALPLTLGILMDTSGSMETIFRPEQEAASRFLGRVLQPKDLAMIMTFDTDVDLMADFTNDHDRLERAIQRAKVHRAGGMVTPGTVPSPSGGTNLYDAVWLACKEKLARESGRKSIILLTDAEDTGSKTSLKDAIEIAQRTDAVIHVLLITVRSGFGFGGGNAGVGKKLAEETGGRMIEVNNEKDLQRAFDQISEELRSQYTLGYYSTNGTRDGSFRKVKVETRDRSLNVLTRKGYYAPKG